MKSIFVLALASLLLAGCATRSTHVLRRGKLIERPAVAVAIAPASPTTAPSVAPATPAAVAPVAPIAPAIPVTVESPVVAAPAPIVATSVSVAAPEVSAPSVAPASFESPLVAARTGATVNLRWTLPGTASGYRAIEIMRHTRAEAAGRGRVRAVRAETTSIQDSVPDTNANYWYWLKITHVDGTVQNLGPFAATVES